jgi:hypothetical protein
MSISLKLAKLLMNSSSYNTKIVAGLSNDISFHNHLRIANLFAKVTSDISGNNIISEIDISKSNIAYLHLFSTSVGSSIGTIFNSNTAINNRFMSGDLVFSGLNYVSILVTREKELVYKLTFSAIEQSDEEIDIELPITDNLKNYVYGNTTTNVEYYGFRIYN